jgi:hypothetical protein
MTTKLLTDDEYKKWKGYARYVESCSKQPFLPLGQLYKGICKDLKAAGLLKETYRGFEPTDKGLELVVRSLAEKEQNDQEETR